MTGRGDPGESPERFPTTEMIVSTQNRVCWQAVHSLLYLHSVSVDNEAVGESVLSLEDRFAASGSAVFFQLHHLKSQDVHSADCRRNP